MEYIGRLLGFVLGLDVEIVRPVGIGPMRLWSDAFPEGGEIPLEYTKDGYNTSPPFRWADLPPDTRELVLIFEGVTPATHEPCVHWLVYKIPAGVEGLPQGFRHMREPEQPLHFFRAAIHCAMSVTTGRKARSGASFAIVFAFWRWMSRIDAEPGLDKERLEKIVRGYVLEEAELHAVYERHG